MRHKTTGILFVIFGVGLVVGSTAVAVGLNETGASILMIILGIYLVIKGVRVYANDEWHGKNYSNGGSTKSSSIGILLLGFFLFIVGAGLSATIIAIPIMIVGMVLIVAGS